MAPVHSGVRTSGEFEGSEFPSTRAGSSTNHNNPRQTRRRQLQCNTPTHIISGIAATSYLANICAKEPALRSNLIHLQPILNSILRLYRKFRFDQIKRMYPRASASRFARLEEMIKQGEMKTKAKGVCVVTFDDDEQEIIQ